MGLGPWRWLVLFFTRPVHLSDLAAVLRPLKRREKAVPVAAAPAAEEGRQRPVRPRASAAPGEAAARPRAVSLRAPALDVGVSEQPLDTLPAELQSEFRITGTAELDPPRSGTGPAEG